jgi:hypothetical protein
LKGANTAFGIISHLFDPGLAPRMPAFAAAARLAANLPLVDGPELRELGVQFEAELTSEGDLALTIGFTQGEITGLRSVWIGFEANRQWLRLGTADIFEGTASVHLPGFGKLLSLSPGQLPSNIFALRLDDWPTVCADGALVVQAGDEPFAEIETDPLIEDGNVCVDIRLLPHVADLRRSNELEMWFGTGGHVWQLLGRWPIPQDAGNTMSLKCPSPKPGQVGLVFPGVLKLALRP